MPVNDKCPQGDLQLGALIKAAMLERGLSLRKLSELCDVSPSTISRILNNKQPANIGHLQAFSTHLGIPLAQLLRACGLEIGEAEDRSSRIVLDVIGDILHAYDVSLDEFIPEIRRDLRKYEHYARTTAGKDAIVSGFLPKLSDLNGDGVIIDRLLRLYDLYLSEEVENRARAVAGSALLYLISMPDVIPDYVFPVGYLDDAIAVVLTVNRLAEEFNVKLP